MTITETTEWFQNFQTYPFAGEALDITLCVPFTVLSKAKELIEQMNLPIHLGAQDVSPFGKGPYTGEISAEMIAELATYVLVGHSERRQYFDESEEERAFQVLQAKTAGLTVVYCVPDGNETVPESVDIIAYEPVEAIGSGNPESPKDVQAVTDSIRNRYQKPILYGGSVGAVQVPSYKKISSVDGFLVGGASLDAKEFASICTATNVV